MDIIDLHTHRENKNAITSVSPFNFFPEPGYYYSVGIHPWEIQQVDLNKEEWVLLQELSNHPQVVAIGEVGLDKVKGGEMDLQLEWFKKQINLAGKQRKPLIVHAVRTANEIIHLRKELKSHIPWVIHGFRNNEHIAQQLLQHDFYLSFGEKYSVEALRCVPLEKMFIETDESEKDIYKIYKQIATHLRIPQEYLEMRIKANMEKIFFNQ